MPLHPDPPRGPIAIVRRLFVDFFRNAFGSDTTVAYTAEYAWLANQMSHTTMGFFLGVLWSLHGQARGWEPWTLYLVFLFPVAKDAVDVLMDVWRGRSKNFAVNYRELLLDSATDEAYWWIGMAAAFVTVGPWTAIEIRAAVAVVGLGVTLYLAFGVWVPQKRMFDLSRMPFNFVRLVKYPDPASFLPPASLAALREFQAVAAARSTPQPGPRHYMLVGGRPVQRSGLAVSMGCEYISHWRGVYMISAVKVLEDPERLRRHCQMAKEFKAEVRCLIIDDLNVNLPVPAAAAAAPAKAMRARWSAVDAESAEARQADRLLHFVEVFDELRTLFPQVATVWVASANVADPADQARLAQWVQFVRVLARAESLTTVELTDPTSPGSVT